MTTTTDVPPARTTAAVEVGVGEDPTSAVALVCTATRHDTEDAYVNDRCRCPAARRQHVVARKRRELRLITAGPERIDATGTARRLQALAALGYGVHDLAVRVSIDAAYLGHLRRPSRPRVLRSTANVIASVYDELADTTGPRNKARRHAERMGWLPPKWWDADTIDDPGYVPVVEDPARHWSDIDPVAVERAMAGEPMPLTRGERLRVVALLEERGASHLAIARTLGVHPRQVNTDLARIRLSPSAPAAGSCVQTRTIA